MSRPLLEARGITVHYGGLVAVNDVSMSLQPGAIHGLIGPNGAGKTTFFNAITGLVPASAGTLIFDDADLTGQPAHRCAASGMRRTFQAVQLVPQFTVLENVLVGMHAVIRDNLFTSLFGLPGGNAGEYAAQAAVREVLDFLGIGNTLLRLVGELSFVEQRFVEIARAIVSRPKLLLLDEPAAGLSPGDVTRLDALLRRLRNERGMTILLVEHVLSLVMGICERITVLENGRLIHEGTPQEVSASPAVRAAYLGTGDA
jgi:ABC-type branched-subunit amino acid transport system ATPase component